MVTMKIPATCLVAMLVACTTAKTGPSSPIGSGASTACGPAAIFGTDPALGGHAVKLGPLWLYGFARSSGRAFVRLGAGRPTKVLISFTRVIEGETVELRGQDCSSGRALRFCYDGSRCLGKAAGVTLQKVELGGLGYTGYMLFPATGNYRLQVTRSSQQLGAAVVHVRSPR